MAGNGAPCGPPGMQSGGCNGTGYAMPAPATSSYVVNSKIMVVAVLVLFAVVVFILSLHVYAKWFWRTRAAVAAEGPMGLWRTEARVGSASNGAAPAVQQGVGLDKGVIEALPMFEFSGEGRKGSKALECVVCLEDFKPGERGRTLPKCGHHFHLNCVDMWLYSHSTCPLCRASVQPDDSKSPADPHSRPLPPVIGNVHAPFMAAMRASRRRQRSSQMPPPSLTSHTNATHDLTESPVATEPQTLAPTETSPQETPPLHETPTADRKALARAYDSTTDTQRPQPSASSIRAPFQVTIDIPRNASSLHPANVMSPMARASASFRRLVSRGKSMVSPRDDDGADEGGPSSQSPPTPPPPPNP